MKRREFIQFSTGALASLAVVQGSTASPQEFHQRSRPRSQGTAILRVLAIIHPMDLEYRFNLCGHFLWVDLDLSTGEYSVCSEFDYIYMHPMANWIAGAHSRVLPKDRTPRFPVERPLVPDYWLWPGVAGTSSETEFLTKDMARFVKTPMARDILEGIGEEGQRPKDRRDDFDLLWVDWDLATGEYEECAVDDPIYDSVLCNGVTPEYEKWKMIEMVSKEEIEAFFRIQRG